MVIFCGFRWLSQCLKETRKCPPWRCWEPHVSDFFCSSSYSCVLLSASSLSHTYTPLIVHIFTRNVVNEYQPTLNYCFPYFQHRWNSFGSMSLAYDNTRYTSNTNYTSELNVRCSLCYAMLNSIFFFNFVYGMQSYFVFRFSLISIV